MQKTRGYRVGGLWSSSPSSTLMGSLLSTSYTRVLCKVYDGLDYVLGWLDQTPDIGQIDVLPVSVRVFFWMRLTSKLVDSE